MKGEDSFSLEVVQKWANVSHETETIYILKIIRLFYKWKLTKPMCVCVEYVMMIFSQKYNCFQERAEEFNFMILCYIDHTGILNKQLLFSNNIGTFNYYFPT